MKRLVTAITLFLAAFAFFSCKENDLEKQRQNELKKLDEYIQNNYPDLEPTPSGLYFIELEEGTGDSIQIGDRVQLFYDMWTLDSVYIDGNIEESGRYEPIELVVLPPSELSSSASSARNMLGLHEALTYMKDDGKAKMILPSQLAFGQYGSYGVTGFTTLVMEVEIYKVYPADVPGEE